VGLAARACGVARDIRANHPSGTYRHTKVPVSTWPTGDVFARALVRYYEMKTSAAFAIKQLDALPNGSIGDICQPCAALPPDHLAVSLVEGFRGEICHVAITDKEGHIGAYKVVDPSFHNWSGLAMAMRGGEISDFPVVNKSFNLSYCGHDL